MFALRKSSRVPIEMTTKRRENPAKIKKCTCRLLLTSAALILSVGVCASRQEEDGEN